MGLLVAERAHFLRGAHKHATGVVPISRNQTARVESRRGAVAWAVRHHSVSPLPDTADLKEAKALLDEIG